MISFGLIVGSVLRDFAKSLRDKPVKMRFAGAEQPPQVQPASRAQDHLPAVSGKPAPVAEHAALWRAPWGRVVASDMKDDPLGIQAGVFVLASRLGPRAASRDEMLALNAHNGASRVASLLLSPGSVLGNTLCGSALALLQQPKIANHPRQP